MRIASLVPHATELLFALGLGPEVVAVTHECDYPPAARAVRRVTRDVLPAAVRNTTFARWRRSVDAREHSPGPIPLPAYITYVMYATLAHHVRESGSPMPEPVSISSFRQKAGPYFTEAVHRHSPLAIRRGGEDLGLLLGGDEAWALLADRSFSPEVMRGDDSRGDGGVSIWLPEFAIYGQGATYGEAKADLLEEVRVYVDEYLTSVAEYRRAPNRVTHLPHVIKAYLAELRSELEQVIFPGPPDPPVARSEDVRVSATR